MLLWELKNAIISQNLRELCDIKANTKIHTHSGFDKLSHQIFYYTMPEPVEGRVGEKNFSQQIPEPIEGTTFLDLPQNIEPTTIKNRSPK